MVPIGDMLPDPDGEALPVGDVPAADEVPPEEVFAKFKPPKPWLPSRGGAADGGKADTAAVELRAELGFGETV